MLVFLSAVTEVTITNWWTVDYKMNSCDDSFRFNSNDGCL